MTHDTRAYRDRVMAVLEKHVQRAKGLQAEYAAAAATSGDRKLDTMAAVFRVVAEHVELAALDARTVGLLDEKEPR